MQKSAERLAAKVLVFTRIEDEFVPELVGDLRFEMRVVFADLAQEARRPSVSANELRAAKLVPRHEPGRAQDERDCSGNDQEDKNTGSHDPRSREQNRRFAIRSEGVADNFNVVRRRAKRGKA